MNVFIVSAGQDTGGQAQRTVAAFRKYAPDWNVRAMVAGGTYIRFPVDLAFDFDVAKRLYDRADVVHHFNWLYAYTMYERGQCKPTIIHHHGPPLRDHADEVNAEAASVGALQVVATVDLLEQAPAGVEWLPGFYDLGWIRREFPRTRKADGKIRIGHGPTVRASKGTDEILAALDRVSARVRGIELELIEGVSWYDSLRRKAQCDIWIDQITLGYGGSAIEAMAMGIPTISGWSSTPHQALFLTSTQRHTFPFMHATAFNIEEQVEYLATDTGCRVAWSGEGREFVEEWHSDRAGVERLQRIYASAKPSLGRDRLRMWNGDEAQQVALRKWGSR